MTIKITSELEIAKDFSAWPGEQFFSVEIRQRTTVVNINMEHRFYRDVYEPLLKNANVEAVLAIDMLLTAFAEAESELDNDSDKFEEIRSRWGHYISIGCDCLHEVVKIGRL